MSIKKMRIMIIISTGIVVGAVAQYFHARENTRLPAADESVASLKYSGKPGQQFVLKIDAVNGTPNNDEQELTLKATIEVLQPIPKNELSFKWILPQGASVVSGHVEDSLPNIHVGQTATVEITVTGVSSDGIEKHILFNAFYLVGTTVVSNSAVYSTKRNDGAARLPSSQDSKVDSRAQQKRKIKFNM